MGTADMLGKERLPWSGSKATSLKDKVKEILEDSRNGRALQMTNSEAVINMGIRARPQEVLFLCNKNKERMINMMERFCFYYQVTHLLGFC